MCINSVISARILWLNYKKKWNFINDGRHITKILEHLKNDYLGYIPLTIVSSNEFPVEGPAAFEISNTIRPLVCIDCFPSLNNFLTIKDYFTCSASFIVI